MVKSTCPGVSIRLIYKTPSLYVCFTQIKVEKKPAILLVNGEAGIILENAMFALLLMYN
jgi:hypothetical protein